MSNILGIEETRRPFRTYLMVYFRPVVKTTGYISFPLQGNRVAQNKVCPSFISKTIIDVEQGKNRLCKTRILFSSLVNPGDNQM